jgi:glucosamine-6-phosphate deaminase
MDEYIGLDEDAPQGFGNFLRRALFDKVPFKSVNYMYAKDIAPKKACENYAELISRQPIDIVFMGIGENGHIAFNDPHVALFDDPEVVKIVSLDDICRMQQVNDGCFDSFNLVPTHAMTLTLSTLMKADRIFCVVPATSKAAAIDATINGDVTEACPSSILRTHKNATLYCDADSGRAILDLLRITS